MFVKIYVFFLTSEVNGTKYVTLQNYISVEKNSQGSKYCILINFSLTSNTFQKMWRRSFLDLVIYFCYPYFFFLKNLFFFSKVECVDQRTMNRKSSTSQKRIFAFRISRKIVNEIARKNSFDWKLMTKIYEVKLYYKMPHKPKYLIVWTSNVDIVYWK